MKLYIAGPMTGIAEFNYPEFRRVGEELSAVGYEVLNPVMIDSEHADEIVNRMNCLWCSNGERHDWQWYMRRAIKMVADAQGLATLTGWEKSRGARIEVSLASALEMPIASAVSWKMRHKYLQKEWG